MGVSVSGSHSSGVTATRRPRPANSVLRPRKDHPGAASSPTHAAGGAGEPLPCVVPVAGGSQRCPFLILLSSYRALDPPSVSSAHIGQSNPSVSSVAFENERETVKPGPITLPGLIDELSLLPTQEIWAHQSPHSRLRRNTCPHSPPRNVSFSPSFRRHSNGQIIPHKSPPFSLQKNLRTESHAPAAQRGERERIQNPWPGGEAGGRGGGRPRPQRRTATAMPAARRKAGARHRRDRGPPQLPAAGSSAATCSGPCARAARAGRTSGSR